MLNWEKSGLEIFDNFHIDFNLPKWKERMNKSANEGDVGTVPTFNTMSRTRTGGVTNGFLLTPTASFTVNGGIDGSPAKAEEAPKKINFFDKLFGRAKKRRLLEEQRIKEEMEAPNFEVVDPSSDHLQNTVELTVEEFFASVKNSAEELELVKERYANYEKSISHLKRSGQLAVLERMEHELEIHRAETQLFAIGFRKVITEENVSEFAKKGCRELRLDWIKNFARLIPEAVLDAKEKCDENNIFDNYVILHYDPYKNGTQKTQAEIEAERKKDPILFGVIAGSNKLYYVADWIDEYCDLTFDKIVEKLGEDAIKANDLTVDIKITKL